MSNIISHVEKYAGRMLHGWPYDPDGGVMPFQIVEFEGGPFDGCGTLVTLGLSNFALAVPTTNKVLRLEYLMLFRKDHGARNLPEILQQVAAESFARASTFLRGDVIGPRGSIVEGLPFEALYVSKPVYFKDEFGVFTGPNEQSVTFIWLVPITAGEASFIKRHGWEAFERKLVEVDPDLTDLNRASIA